MTTHLKNYLQNLDRERARGLATEHSYRPALKNLLEELDPGIRAAADSCTAASPPSKTSSSPITSNSAGT